MVDSYTPYGGAKELWQCREDEILYDGPAGTGKTRAALEKCHLMAMKYPGARILLVRKTRASMSQSVLVTLEEKVFGNQLNLKSGARRTHRESYKYPNGSELVVGGLDNADRIMSTEYDAFFLAEATESTEDDWEKLLTRLRNGKMPYQQAIADCNPSYPRHWLKIRADEGRMKRIQSRHEDNPTVTKSYLDRLSKLSGHRKARLYKGTWTAAEGLVYDSWDSSVFVKRLDEYEPKRIIISVDEGYTNPCSMHVHLIDGDGRDYIRHEFYKTGQKNNKIIKQLKSWKEQYPELEAVVVDPSAKKLIVDIQDADLPVIGANNDITGGIQAVQERLEVPGDGNPRLVIDPDCKNAIMEMESYQWKENKDGTKQDKPEKKNDHAMDEIRYGTMYLAENSGNFEVFAI